MLSSKRIGSRLASRAAVSKSSLGPSRRIHQLGRTSAARVATPLSSVHRHLLQSSLFYSTERVLSLRTGKNKDFQPKTVYTPDNEKENCGVGLVASLKSVPSRRVVEQADEMLVRMSHRGGCGCDPASGDGAGEYIWLCDEKEA